MLIKAITAQWSPGGLLPNRRYSCVKRSELVDLNRSFSSNLPGNHCTIGEVMRGAHLLIISNTAQ